MKKVGRDGTITVKVGLTATYLDMLENLEKLGIGIASMKYWEIYNSMEK